MLILVTLNTESVQLIVQNDCPWVWPMLCPLVRHRSVAFPDAEYISTSTPEM